MKVSDVHRRSFHGLCRAAVFGPWLLAAALVILHGAAAPASAAEPADAAALPAPPAFYTANVSRVSAIDGDSFDLARPDGKTIKVRLFDADCRPCGEAARSSAKALAHDLFEGQPFWVFPCGQTKGPSGDEVWAHVWTSKGWFAEILIRAGYAQRRADFGTAALAAPDSSGAASKGPPPDAPAFASAACTATDADAYEVDQAGKKVRVRLFDCTVEGLDASQQEAAKSAAVRAIGGRPVWVFPCASRRDDPHVRIWTKEGWLSEALVKAGATRLNPDKAAAVPVAKVETPKKTGPAKKTESAKPDESAITWREVPITGGAKSSVGAAVSSAETGVTVTPMSAESATFQMPTALWRISWNLKPVRDSGYVCVNVYRVDDQWQTRTSSTHVASFNGLSGAQYVRSKPGNYWIRVTGSVEMGVKVEIPEQAGSPAATPAPAPAPKPAP